MWIEREHQASSRDLDKCVQKGIDSPHGFEIFIHNQTRFIPTSNSTGYKFKSKRHVYFLLLQNLLHSLNMKDTLEI